MAYQKSGLPPIPAELLRSSETTRCANLAHVPGLASDCALPDGKGGDLVVECFEGSGGFVGQGGDRGSDRDDVLEVVEPAKR
jgi:hypothetical protein